jgi:hypothetical protein
MPAVDVVTVPDFSGAASPRFELRTLLFLGSWLQHRGRSRTWAVHLACIGEPPASVRRMAERAGARITTHAPVDARWTRPCNKLRGLEISPTAPRFLLVDTDALVLQDLQPLAEIVGDAVGLGPATFNPLPDAMWRRIFESASLPYPVPAGSAPPYHNSGVVMGSWNHRLHLRWAGHIDRLLTGADAAFWDQVPGSARFANQYALATAVAEMVLEGTRVVTLPLRDHARPPHLDAGLIRWTEVALLHYPRLLEPYGETAETIVAWLYGTRACGARRRLSRWLGLRLVRAPILRGQPPAARRAWWGAFAHRVHRIVQEFGHLW